MNSINYELVNDDCTNVMQKMPNGCVDLLLTDIPYDGVNRIDNGLRTLDKGTADIITFPLDKFLSEVYRITKGTAVIFCGRGQFSEIYKPFVDMQLKGKGTTRQLIWEKTNPSPMNGEYVYLSGIENAVWFKKHLGIFKPRCKNTVFRHPSGSSQLHPTEKNHALLEELILDNSDEDALVFDPCMGSGSAGLVALSTGRNFKGVELDKQYFSIAKKRIDAKMFLLNNPLW